jgi:cytochrome c1
MGRILLGILIGVLVVPLVVVGWFWFGHVPVAVADAPLPHERSLVAIPLHSRIHREMIKKVPILVDEGDLVAGAHVYREHCAMCHGFHGKPADMGTHIYPAAPQLWEKHGEAVGVSDDAPGETYWKVVNGIRLTGMPAYKGVLNDTEIWQVSVLLANADKPLPPATIDLLHGDPNPNNSAVSDQNVADALSATEKGAASKKK